MSAGQPQLDGRQDGNDLLDICLDIYGLLEHKFSGFVNPPPMEPSLAVYLPCLTIMVWEAPQPSNPALQAFCLSAGEDLEAKRAPTVH